MKKLFSAIAAILIKAISYDQWKSLITKINYLKYFNTFPLMLTACYFIFLFSFYTATNGGNYRKGDDCQNITNAVLTNRSPYCKDYVGKYCATIKDVYYDSTLIANFSIEHAGDKCIWHTNALPNHDFNDNKKISFPNRVMPQTYRFEISDNPTFAATKIPLSLDYYNAILLNGALVDLLSDGCCCPPPLPLDPSKCGDCIINCTDINNPWRKDPMSKKTEFNPDSHNAHSQGDGTYHYHGPPNALYDTKSKTESPVIGFAADGFPIYGPYINDNGKIRKVKSSYRLIDGKRPSGSCPGETKFDGTFIQDYIYDPTSTKGDLDECNGMTRNGHYAYYLTDEYPYMIKFFKGTPDSSFKKLLK